MMPFIQNKGDVINMLLTEFNQKEYEDMLRNEYLEEGRAEGRAEGHKEKEIEMINKIISKGIMSLEDACNLFEVSVEELRK